MEIPTGVAKMIEDTKKDYEFKLKKIQASIDDPKVNDSLLNFQKCLIYEAEGDKKKHKQAIIDFMRDQPSSYVPPFLLGIYYFNRNKFEKACWAFHGIIYYGESEEHNEKDMILIREQFTGATQNLQKSIQTSMETVSKFVSYGQSYFGNLGKHFTQTISNDFYNNIQLLTKTFTTKKANKYIEPHEMYFFSSNVIL